MEEHRLEAQRKTFTLLPALEQNGSHKDELCVECERWASVTVTTSPEPASTFRADMKLRGALARWQADMMIQTRSWGHTKNNWTCFDQTKTSPVSSFHCDITHIQNAWTLSAVCVCDWAQMVSHPNFLLNNTLPTLNTSLNWLLIFP